MGGCAFKDENSPVKFKCAEKEEYCAEEEEGLSVTAIVAICVVGLIVLIVTIIVCKNCVFKRKT